jgi:phage replication O-like protein O
MSDGDIMGEPARVYNLEERREAAGFQGGFTRSSNIILDQLCKCKISGGMFQVALAIHRLTSGYNKPIDIIANIQISELTDQAPNHVAENKQKLLQCNIVLRDGRKIGINPNVSEWKIDPTRASKKYRNKDSKVPKRGLNKNPDLGTRESVNKESAVPVQGLKNPDSGTHQRQDITTKDIKTKNKGLDLSVVPEWLNPQLVTDFIDHRKTIKKPMTQVALNRLITKLDDFRQRGIDPAAALGESIISGWTGVFEPKGGIVRTSAPRHFSGAAAYSGMEGFADE